MYNWVWAIACLIFAAIFGLMSLIFSILKEKGAILISGFNTLSPEERLKYDRARMSKDMRNSLLLWTVIFLLGAALAYYVFKYIALVSFAVWLILFFRDVHSDYEKAFKKYRI